MSLSQNNYSAIPSYAEAVAEKPATPSWIVASESEQVALYASKPSENERYQRVYEVRPQTMSMPVAASLTHTSRASCRTVPAGWRECVHPEGLPFYYHEEWYLVTDNDIRNPDTLALLTAAYVQASSTAKAFGYELDNCDLCIRVDASSSQCYYYLVDHSNRKVFWLHDESSETIGLQDAVSETHLGHLLTEEYWIHVEFFPLCIADLNKAISELQTALGYGLADQLTSENSTFPYDDHKCRELLNVLQTPGIDSTHLVWVTARFSATIARHRFDTFFGEEHARLGREQRRLEHSAPQKTFITKALSTFVFHASDTINSELELLYVDNIVYTIHWRKFISSRLADWAECSTLSMGILGLAFAGFLLSKSESARSVGLVTAIIALGSLLGSTALRRKYSDGEKLHAADVCDHVRALQHPRYGYQVAAAMLALPRALQNWAILGFGAQLILCALDLLDTAQAVFVCAASSFVLILLYVMASVLSREPTQPPGDGDTGAWIPLIRGVFGANGRVNEVGSMA